MTSEKNDAVKKRMMYSKGDDFNFLTYNLLVLASELNCFEKNKPFVDHRKTAFLVGFVSNPWVTNLALDCKELNSAPTHVDRSELTKFYADGSQRIHLITRLLFAFERKGILSLHRSQRTNSIDFSINQNRLPADFLGNQIFEMERENVSRLRKVLPQLRKAKLSTVLGRLFAENGVRVWHA